MSTHKSCPNCGTTTTPEARYCRRCGTPLRGAAQGNGAEVISPLAATVPLIDEGRTTDGLADDPRRPAGETTRVNQAELEAILRAPQREPEPDTEGAAPEVGRQTIVDRSPQADATDAAGSDAVGRARADEPARNYATRTAQTYGAAEDEELTLTVPRPTGPFSEPSAPLQVQPIPVVGSAPLAAGAFSVSTVDTAGAASAAAASPRRRRAWPFVVAACVAVLLLTAAAAVLVSRLRNKPADAGASVGAPVAPDASAAKKLSADKLTEAEGLLAAGDLSGAVSRLRESVRLDPASVKAHRRLAEVLSESGARREAIEEFRAVTQLDPNDFTAWRALAFAQLGEGFYDDAAESFRRLLALTGGGAEQDSHDLLAYADALRQAGRSEEARAVYQKLSSVSAAEVAAAARQHLAEMAATQAGPSPEPTRPPAVEAAQPNQHPETTQAPVAATTTTTTTAPTPVAQSAPTPGPPATTTSSQKAALTSQEHYARGLSLWSSNRAAALQEFRAAGDNPDANYYIGLSYVEGRDLHSLKRAEIVAALQSFQIARRGRFSRQAQQYERQLGKEFDRLRN